MDELAAIACLLVLDQDVDIEEPPGRCGAVTHQRQLRFELVVDNEAYAPILDAHLAHLRR